MDVGPGDKESATADTATDGGAKKEIGCQAIAPEAALLFAPEPRTQGMNDAFTYLPDRSRLAGMPRGITSGPGGYCAVSTSAALGTSCRTAAFARSELY